MRDNGGNQKTFLTFVIYKAKINFKNKQMTQREDKEMVKNL